MEWWQLLSDKSQELRLKEGNVAFGLKSLIVDNFHPLLILRIAIVIVIITMPFIYNEPTPWWYSHQFPLIGRLLALFQPTIMAISTLGFLRFLQSFILKAMDDQFRMRDAFGHSQLEVGLLR